MTNEVSILKAEIDKLHMENAIQNQIISELKSVPDYIDEILKNKDLVSINEIAEDYDLSVSELTKMLYETNINHLESGLCVMKWTQKGRLFIHELLKSIGIIAVMDRKDNND